jgi:hypothetical protein
LVEILLPDVNDKLASLLSSNFKLIDMAEVIREREVPVETHHYHTEPSSSNSMGWIAPVAILLVVLFLLYYYGLPAVRSVGGTQVNVPDKINVNVTTPQQQAPQ